MAPRTRFKSLCTSHLPRTPALTPHAVGGILAPVCPEDLSHAQGMVSTVLKCADRPRPLSYCERGQKPHARQLGGEAKDWGPGQSLRVSVPTLELAKTGAGRTAGARLVQTARTRLGSELTPSTHLALFSGLGERPIQKGGKASRQKEGAG